MSIKKCSWELICREFGYPKHSQCLGSLFEVKIEDFIPSDNYNSDNIDFINENEEFVEPHQRQFDSSGLQESTTNQNAYLRANSWLKRTPS